MAVRILGHFRLFAKNNPPRRQCEEFFEKAVIPRALRSISTTFRAPTSSDDGNINEHNSKVRGPATRLMRIAMIGEPNSGKSTLTNRLVCNQVSVVTHVPHTTRQRTLGVYTEGTVLYNIQ
jgi:ribosome biogenesis GTPase A